MFKPDNLFRKWWIVIFAFELSQRTVGHDMQTFTPGRVSMIQAYNNNNSCKIAVEVDITASFVPAIKIILEGSFLSKEDGKEDEYLGIEN